MNKDTNIGGPAAAFPETRASAVQALRSTDPAVRDCGFEAVVSGCWKPIYKYLRVKWTATNEEAKDLTQAFFARVIEKDLLSGYDAGKSAFRTYVRVCLDGFISNERAAAGRIKRGGGKLMYSLDFDAAEREFQRQEFADPSDLEDYYHVEWIRDLFSRAVDALRADLESRDKRVHFQLFEKYDLTDHADGGRPTYEALGRSAGLSVTQVTNYLAAARREFRACLLKQLRMVTGSDDEYRDEARALLGVDVE
jgi:DNA-directed RNA polymerase specialized sigma24 family protein